MISHISGRRAANRRRAVRWYMHGCRVDGNRVVSHVFACVLKVLFLFDLAKVTVTIEIVHRHL